MSLLFFSPKKRAAAEPQDWSQQELAEVYRVLDLLQRAGIRVDLDRGVTDKNEPWCVFFDPTGDDIFLHIARLNGEYVLVSDAIEIKATGPSFRTVVDQFEDAVGLTVQNNAKRKSNVVVHPASQLMFSLVAVLLMVKAKAAQAASSLDDLSDGSGMTELAKMRAFLGRLQETIDNPAMMVAMVSALVFSATALQEEASLISPEIAGKETDHNVDQQIASDGAHINIDVARAELASQNSLDKTEATGADAVAAASTKEEMALKAEEIHVAGIQGDQVNAAFEASKASTDVDAEQVAEDAVTQPPADTIVVTDSSASKKSSGSAAASAMESDVDTSLVDSAELLIATIFNDTSLESSEFITLAQGEAAVDAITMVGLAALEGGASLIPEETAPIQIDPFASITADMDINTISNALNSSDQHEKIHKLMALFDQVDIYSYGGDTLFIVDTDVRFLSGDQISFFNEETSTGLTVSLVGSREIFDSLEQA